jgi:hypothetical protein
MPPTPVGSEREPVCIRILILFGQAKMAYLNLLGTKDCVVVVVGQAKMYHE